MIQGAGDLAVTRQGGLITAKNNLYQVSFDLSKGAWSYIDSTGYQIIKDAYTKLVLQDGTVVTTQDGGDSEFITDALTEDEFGIYQPITFSYHAESQGLDIHLYLNCYSRRPYVVLSVGVENRNDAPIALEQISLIDVSPNNSKGRGGVYLGGNPASYRTFLNMNTSITQGVREVHDGFHINQDSSEFCCDGILYDTETKRSLVFGFLSFKKWWSAIQVGYSAQTQSKAANQGLNYWTLYHKCENQRCPGGEEVRSEPIYLNFASKATESYQLYAEMVAKRMNATPLKQVFSGWRSYTKDDGQMSTEQISQKLDQMTKNRSFAALTSHGLEYIQIESTPRIEGKGSQEVNGKKSPHPMKWMADQIHAKALKAGIRFTPFCADMDSELLAIHPEYFLQDREGKKPASLVLPDNGTEVAVLDVSHPGAQTYIREQTRKLVDDWAYDLVKADLYAYTMGPMMDASNYVWHDQSLTSVELYRLGAQLLNEIIRESKREAILAACNACSGPSIGSFLMGDLFSGYGGYIGEGLWKERRGIKQIANVCAAYLPMHRTVWTNEFGALCIDEPRPLNEALATMTIAALSGGIVVCGDDFTALKPSRAKLLAKIFPQIGKAATPVDLYERIFPRIWNLRVESPYESWNVVGVFNWGDGMGEIDLTLEALGLERSKYYLVHDFWHRDFLGAARDRLTLLDIPPRSVKLLCLRAEQQAPQLLATDIHFTQGGIEVLSAGWDGRSQSFLAVCKLPERDKGTLFIHTPESYVPATTACYGADYHFRWRRPIYECELNPTADLVHVSVQFARTSG